jgi:hypothetical protein
MIPKKELVSLFEIALKIDFIRKTKYWRQVERDNNLDMDSDVKLEIDEGITRL